MFRFFENLVDPFQSYVEADQPPRRLLPFLFTYLKPFRRILLAAFILTTLATIIELSLISYAGWLIDLLGTTERENLWQDHGCKLLALAAFILILRPLVSFLDVAFLYQTLMPNLASLIRFRAHNHVLRQSVGWFENDFAGRVANRVMQTPPAAGGAAFQVFDALLHAAIYFIGSLFLVFQLGTGLVWLMLLWIIGFLGICAWLVPRVAIASERFAAARSKFNARVVDAYTNIQAVKLFAHTARESDYAKTAIEETRSAFHAETRLFTILEIGLSVLSGLALVAIIGTSVYQWQQGVASIGEVTAVTALCLRLSNMTFWIAGAMTSFFEEMGVIAEGMQTIAQPIAITDRPGAKPLAISHGAITIDHLSHHYGKETGGLDQLTLIIQGGEKVGLVGRSGAGKSTLVNLLLRFHEMERGHILIDGQDIQDVTQNSLRAQIGMVTQDNSLMHRSIADNIRYGRPEATDAQVVEAAKQAEAHDFILGLEDQEGNKAYESQVGERGVKLSGGQRQRIALARVILKNAPLLILDEATSALDSEAEAAIQETLYKVMEGKTVIAIAHRLSTIAHMDRILVMDQGRIAEQGTHKELLAKDGLYASFWARQSGGFIGTET